MMYFRTLLIISLVWSVFSCRENKKSEKSTPPSQLNYHLIKTSFPLPTQSSFRGLCVVNAAIAWASGSGGTFVKTVNGGLDWNVDTVPGASKMDFRDIEAFNKDTALVMNAGYPGKIYKTVDGGMHWKETYSNLDSAIFLDGFDFWDEKRGVAFGDPIGGKLVIIWTEDGGDSWTEVPPHNIPDQLTEEAGFAASGTSIVTWAGTHAIIGLGGTKARVYSGLFTDANWDDGGHTWSAHTTPIVSGNASRGIYSISFGNENEGIAVGGAWNDDSLSNTKAYTTNGGLHWLPGNGVEAYRSGSCYVNNHTYLATGLSGTDISYDGGKNWKILDTAGFNAIEFDKKGEHGFAVGPKGKLVGLELKIETSQPMTIED